MTAARPLSGWAEGLKPIAAKPYKITVIGDGAIGKTCLLSTFATNEYPKEYIPTVFENHETTFNVDNKDYCLTLWDTAGQEDFEKLRLLSYPKTNCFIVCYSIANKDSFKNIEKKWIPEIMFYTKKDMPMVLVGTKLDLRVPGSEKFVSAQEADRLKTKLKAFALVECSAMKKINVIKVFEEAVRAIESKTKQRSSCCCCAIL